MRDFRRAAPVWKLVWLASALVVCAAEILPLSNFQWHSHWAKVTWIPFADHLLPGFWLDVVANVLLLVPFGFSAIHALSRSTVGTVVQIMIMGALLMFCGELFQVYCHNRFPSMTDVASGTTGTLAGALIGRRW